MKDFFERFADAHRGEDIWVVGAGASLDFVDGGFFENKIAIGINDVWKKFYTRYLVRKEETGLDATLARGVPVIVSRYPCGSYCLGERPERANGNLYGFEHRDNGHTVVDVRVIKQGSREIVVSYSTVTSAMHLAAVMGARNIILAGCDCGTVDGRMVFGGYEGETKPHVGDDGLPAGNPDKDAPTEADRMEAGEYREWLRVIEPQTLAVRDAIVKHHGCGVHSLNPFVNFGMEGYCYER